MRLNVCYTTLYEYREPARHIVQLLRVTPQSFAGQSVLDWRIDVDSDVRLRAGRDGFGNVTHMLYVDRPVDRLKLTVAGSVLTQDMAGIVQGVAGELPPLVFLRPTPMTAPSPALAALAEKIAGQSAGALDRLHFLAAAINGGMRFDTESTAVDTKAAEAFEAGHGVCQDFTHIFIAAARLQGIPARYVSGHLFRRDGAHSQEAAHAWAEAWVEDLGWVGFDPANGTSPDDAYIRVATGLDYRDAAPTAGARSGGGAEELSVEVLVTRAREKGQFQSQSQVRS
ncbi:MAG: transglutaminase family protein [Alphaproteobacteria bacterium]|nr:transglutaminase family protein [Alphaproteobacteria bacterium]